MLPVCGKQSMHYYLLSEGRRNFHKMDGPSGPARCIVRDFRLFLAPTADLFSFEMNRDFRQQISATRGDQASNHVYPLLSGFVTLLHSTLLILGSCPEATDIEPTMMHCFMSSITPYSFFGVQYGSFQVPKQSVARRVAFLQARHYRPDRLGIKPWDDVDDRIKRWLLADGADTYFLVSSPPAEIFSIGGDASYTF
jgi:hypothetical protein